MVLIPFMLEAQERTVDFEKSLNWQEVLIKAKAEKKHIFLDCFATWCGPCKKMDSDVYPNKKVIESLNAQFISVKIQIDTTNEDNEGIKKWYNDACKILQQYKITTFPTYLFFSSNGEIVHKGIGYKNIDDFLTLVANALDPNKQYYTLINLYQQGKGTYKMMPYLANMAISIHDENIANIISRDYINNYLLKLKEKDLYTYDNIVFIASFIQNSKDKGFDLFYHDSEKVDKVIWKGYSQSVVDYIISKNEIDPKLNNDSNFSFKGSPDWNKIISIISKKYNSNYAERTVINAQIRWYKSKKNWAELAKYYIKKIEKYGIDTTGFGKARLNDMIWEVVFLHSNDKMVINKGIELMEILVRADPGDAASHDTYANLLYKAGRTREAIYWEGKALTIEQNIAKESKTIPNKIYMETLGKMRKGESTWDILEEEKLKD